MSVYEDIAKVLDEQDPLTAPKNDKGELHPAFIRHLELIYTEAEAEIVRHLSPPPFFKPIPEIAEAAGKDPAVVEKIMAQCYTKAAVLKEGDVYCMLPVPSAINYHQQYDEIRPGDLEAAELYQEYFIKDGFSKYYESSKKGTSVSRAIPIGVAIEGGEKVLASEEVEEYIMNHSTDDLALVPCPCRTRTEKMGIRECKDKFPIGACIMLGNNARGFVDVGLGKKVTKKEALKYFNELHALGMVGTTSNAAYGDFVICLCCGCCCSMTRGRSKWDNPASVAASNFIPKAGDDCIACGACTEECFFDALYIDDEDDIVQVKIDDCIGCGICTLVCPQETLKLYRHERTTIDHETSPALMETIFKENRDL